MEKKPRILIADHEDSWIQLYQVVFKNKGYEVVVATSVQAALGLLAEEKFDQVVSDGFRGAFEEIVKTAVSAGIAEASIRVISGRVTLRQQAKALGVSFLLKGSREVQELLK